MWRIKQHH